MPNSLFYHLSLTGEATIIEGLFLEFHVPRFQEKPKSSARFSQIFLPALTGMASSENIRENVRRIRESVRRELRIRRKGKEGEESVLRTLERIRAKRSSLLRDCVRARQLDDMNGNDIVVTFFDAEGNFQKRGIQVKSSKRGQQKHLVHRSEIASIKVHPQETLEGRLTFLIEALRRGEILHL